MHSFYFLFIAIELQCIWLPRPGRASKFEYIYNWREWKMTKSVSYWVLSIETGEHLNISLIFLNASIKSILYSNCMPGETIRFPGAWINKKSIFPTKVKKNLKSRLQSLQINFRKVATIFSNIIFAIFSFVYFEWVGIGL